MQPNNQSRAWLEVNIEGIARNLNRMAMRVTGCSLLAVLKANAYGLGVMPIATRIKHEGIVGFGVATQNEAAPLLALGLPIWVVSALLPGEIPEAVEHGLISPVADLPTAQSLSAEALRQNRVAQAHIMVDTGMGRLGFPFNIAARDITAIAALPGLKIIGLGSHFPNAAGDPDFSNEQIERYLTLLEELKTNGINFQWRHIANSDAITSLPRAFTAPFNMVRAGLHLYGASEGTDKPPLVLENVVTLKARLIAVRRLPAGHSIGYNRTCRLEKDTVVGTVAIGYADGLPFALRGRGNMLLRGKQCPILGRISMDYTTINLNDVPDAQPGEPVTCLGNGITPLTWAGIKDTIPNDILCAISQRVERYYVSD